MTDQPQRASPLSECLPDLLGDALVAQSCSLGEITCEIDPRHIVVACTRLRDDPAARFESLMDLCGVDYFSWSVGAEGENARVLHPLESLDNHNGGAASRWPGKRFVVVYHLLSLHHNARLRLRVGLDDDAPMVDSVVEVWPSADWYEREAFDLFGIIFQGHPDLRRLLTDYGFIGHPMRKDFPLSGQVEMRYDEEQGRVIYQPVTIKPRILVPRTIGETGGEDGGDMSDQKLSVQE